MSQESRKSLWRRCSDGHMVLEHPTLGGRCPSLDVVDVASLFRFTSNVALCHESVAQTLFCGPNPCCPSPTNTCTDFCSFPSSSSTWNRNLLSIFLWIYFLFLETPIMTCSYNTWKRKGNQIQSTDNTAHTHRHKHTHTYRHRFSIACLRPFDNALFIMCTCCSFRGNQH